MAFSGYEIPPAAALWIQEVGTNRPTDYLNTIARQSLVDNFRGAELRKIYEAIPLAKRQASKNANKARLRTMIRQLLFSDYPACVRPNEPLMSHLSRLVEEKRKTGTATSNIPPPPATASNVSYGVPGTTNPVATKTSAAIAANIPKAPTKNPTPTSASAFHPSYPSMYPMNPYRPAGAMMHSPSANWPGAPPYPTHYPSFFPHPQVPGFPPAATYNNGMTHGHAAPAALPMTSRTAPVPRLPVKRPHTEANPIFVKPESSIGDPDATPRDDHEKQVCAQLQQTFGFTDVKEMLTSYRRLKDSTAPTADDVMIDIVSLREEADETKKMDEARKQSEKTRKQEAKKRRRAIEQERQFELESATIAAFRTKHFPNSWILQGSAASRIEREVTQQSLNLKRSLISLLELELKARKWYGATLPRSYFRRILSSTLATCDSLANSLDDRVKYLQTIMFQLSEQTQSGVPIAFRDAYDADAAIDDDEDIELQLTASKKSRAPKPQVKKDVVIIDLVD